MGRFKKRSVPWNKGNGDYMKGEKHFFFGKHHTEESNEKNRLAHLGKEGFWKGKHLSLESIRKMVETRMKIGSYKHSEETKKKMRMSHFGRKYKPMSEEGKRNLSEAQKKVWYNPEHRKRMSEAHKGQIGWNKGKKGLQIAWNKGILMSKEQKRKLSEALKGRLAWNKGKHPPEESIRKQREIMIKMWSNPELRERNRQNTLKQFESGDFPSKTNTKPERQIKEELIKRRYKEGTDFIHQYRFMNKFMCDFCFPQQKIIIEVDGDFWHANPKKYPAGSHLHQHQLKGIGRDKSKSAYIMKVDNGTWTLLRFWEMDIKKDVAKCVDRIEEVLAEKKKI